MEIYGDVMDSIELSIVIPVYNVEKYLSDTIESVRNQTYKQWELILVDDGSSDLTPSICERYAEVDSRIKVVHIKNSGPGKARNIGIELAKGTYIAFVDGDDEYGTKSTLEENMNILREDGSIDVLQFPYESVQLDGKTILNSFSHPYMIDNRPEVLGHIAECKIDGYLWHKIFKKNIFEKLRFPEDMYLMEDMWLMTDVALYGAKFYISTCGRYRYIQREGSLMSSKTAKKELQALNTYYRLLEILYTEPGIKEKYKAYWYMRVVNYIVHFNALFGEIPETSLDRLQPYTPHVTVVFRPFRVSAKIKFIQLKLMGLDRYVKFRVSNRRKKIIRCECQK